MKERIEEFCREVLGLTEDNITTVVMRLVITEAIMKWENLQGRGE